MSWGAALGSRAARIAVVAAVAVGGVVAIARVLDPVEQLSSDEHDGRTWLSTAGSSGGRLLLANGISGLVEAEASLDADALPTGLRFAGSDQRFTMLEGDSVGVVVADGSHAATVVETGDGALSVLGGPGIVTVNGEILTRRLAADGTVGAPATVDATPVADVAPVVDDSGAAWVLAGETADEVVRIGRSGEIDRRVAVEPGATGLLVVDGSPAVRHDATVMKVDGGESQRADADVVPAVAFAAGDTWATATGSAVAVAVGSGGRGTSLDIGHRVRELAVWHGAVWASVDDGVGRVDVDGGGFNAIGDADGPFDVFTDGGRLWFVSPTLGVAIDRLQRATVFRLADASVEICVNECSAADAVDFVTATTLAGTPTTPTTEPTALTLPPVLPSTIAPATTTSTTPTTTTLSPTTTAPPTTAVPATTAAPATTPATTPGTTPTTAARTAPPTPAPTTAAPITLPDLSDLEERPRPRPRPTTEAPATTQPPRSTTTEPAGQDPTPAVRLTLDVGEIGNGQATIYYGWSSDNRWDCPAFARRGSVMTSGAANYRNSHRMEPGETYSQRIDVQPGTLAVSLNVCGHATHRHVEIPAARDPLVSDIAIDPNPPRIGDPARASVQLTAPDGWRPVGATWSVGRCGSETQINGELSDSSASVRFTPDAPGTYCASVVVSFVREGDSRNIERNRQVEVGGGAPEPTPPPGTPPPEPTGPPPDPTEPTEPPPATTEPAEPPPATTEPAEPPPSGPGDIVAPTTPPPTTTPPTEPPASTDAPPTTVDD